MFTFKQFKIDDSHCAMKVGTDGVLLGAWADVTGVKRILDVGCGSGLIALMLAQRAAAARVDGVEIDAAAAADARANVAASPFHDRMTVLCDDVLTLSRNPRQKYDCIVTNPPYHEEDLLPPSSQRAAARHTAGGGLTFGALLQSVRQLLDADSPVARFCVILPDSAVRRFVPAAAVHGFGLTRRTNVVTRPGKPCKRVLLEFRLHTQPLVADELVLMASDGSRSAQYAELCREFYL